MPGDLQKRRLPGAIDRAHADIEAAFSRARDDLAAYSPGTPSDWSGTPPTTIAEALDRIAAAIRAEHSGTTL